jgi:very-short-patch-repair endonuclease
LATSGLPEPVPQLNVVDADGRWIARVDFAWPDQRVILECDGFEYHQDRATFERDRRRWTALTRAGWRVAVVSWHDVVDRPDYLTGLIADLLRSAI